MRSAQHRDRLRPHRGHSLPLAHCFDTNDWSHPQEGDNSLADTTLYQDKGPLSKLFVDSELGACWRASQARQW